LHQIDVVSAAAAAALSADELCEGLSEADTLTKLIKHGRTFPVLSFYAQIRHYELIKASLE
jgi:hypothetical protein